MYRWQNANLETIGSSDLQALFDKDELKDLVNAGLKAGSAKL